MEGYRVSPDRGHEIGLVFIPNASRLINVAMVMIDSVAFEDQIPRRQRRDAGNAIQTRNQARFRTIS